MPFVEGFKCVLEPMLDRYGGIVVLDFDFFDCLYSVSEKSLTQMDSLSPPLSGQLSSPDHSGNY